VLPADPLPEIEWLYRSRLVQFVRVARAIVSDEQLALDAVQEAFTRAVEKRRTFRRSGSIDAWVWRIVVNEARKRTARRGQHVVEDASLPNDAKAPVDVEVRAAVAALPERQRLAVFLRYYADLDYAAIAVVLGVERGTVSATLSAAHRNLAKGLQEAVL
jgi:RNA polymerase sigma factor (sigma-70 family)